MKKFPLLLAPALLVACSPSQLPRSTSNAAVTPTPIRTTQAEIYQSSETSIAPNPIEPVVAQRSSSSKVAQANRTQVPITLISFAPAIRGGEARAVLMVPDRETTQSAYGGKLRRYDVHLAKMFEVSNLYCNPKNGNWNTVEWNYFADNGRINMGKFRLDCNEVRQVVAAYGLGRPERTTIHYYGSSGKASIERIPVLDITGYKVDDFLKFVQTIKPIGKAEPLNLN